MRYLRRLWQILFPPKLSREAQAYRDSHTEEEWEAAWGEWNRRGPDGVFEE